MHLYSTLARGIALKDPPPGTFNQILERLWWRLDKALDEKAVQLSALVPLIQAIRSGTTTLFDHHSSPGFITGSLDILASVFEETGLRGCLCYEVSDRDGPERRGEGIRENIRFLEQCRKEPHPLLCGLFGLHASFTLGEDTLRECVEAAGGLDAGFHVHLAEGRSDLEHCREHYGKTVVKRFADAGILGPRTIAAHCVHITDEDIEILRETRTIAAHNPRSNMNNAVGWPPLPEMLQRGVTVGMGTDGMSPGMMDELKTCNLLYKHNSADPRTGSGECIGMLLDCNPLIAGRLFGEKIGVIEEGAKADLILIDYHPPTPITSSNLTGHILFGMGDAPVDTMLVEGRELMRGREILVLDEEEIAARARETAARVWERF